MTLRFLELVRPLKYFFLCYKLPRSSTNEANNIRKRLLRSVVQKRTEAKLKKATDDINNILSGWGIDS